MRSTGRPATKLRSSHKTMILLTEHEQDRKAIRELVQEKQSLQSELARFRAKEEEFNFQGYENLLITRPTSNNCEKPNNFKQISEKLHQDIAHFSNEHAKYVEKHKPTYDRLVERLETILKEEIPGIEVSIFGSYKTNLWMPWSDIDLVVSLPSQSANSVSKETNQGGSSVSGESSPAVDARGNPIEPRSLLSRIDDLLRVKSSAKEKPVHGSSLPGQSLYSRHQTCRIRKV